MTGRALLNERNTLPVHAGEAKSLSRRTGMEFVVHGARMRRALSSYLHILLIRSVGSHSEGTLRLIQPIL